ncbi:hypothetical protein [Microbacterium hydrocarbonoxydans]|uniref:hypothetical protein n=1 Tax=Microbacterium hydrocarbonoxydans TaxID=273678 RepID=UPI0020413692|nr:hypothetical protein [Microbacterium hydrocarbonoxydans]MCM3779441.1 hypothetical protein [Microbacterium hydrocarbonoxydans]
MTRRAKWILGGAALVVVIVAIVAIVWSTARPAPEASASPAPTPTPSIDLLASAQAEVDEHLEQCAAAGAPDGVMPEACGIRIPWGTEFAAVSDARFRIERMPEVSLTDDGFVAQGGELIATVTGTGQDGAPRTETYRTQNWSVRGDAERTRTGVDITVW